MPITFETNITHDGKITLPEEYRNLSLQQVKVVLITEQDVLQFKKVTDLPFFGMWADRKDMDDSSKWVRQQRKQWHNSIVNQCLPRKMKSKRRLWL